MGFDHEDGKCRECSDGRAMRRLSEHPNRGFWFWQCSNFPVCLNTEAITGIPRIASTLLPSPKDIDWAFYDAFYEGDG